MHVERKVYRIIKVVDNGIAYHCFDNPEKNSPYLLGFARIYPEFDYNTGNHKEPFCPGPKNGTSAELCKPLLEAWENGEKFSCLGCDKYRFENVWGREGKLYLTRGAANQALKRVHLNGEAAIIEILDVVINRHEWPNKITKKE